MSDGNTTWGGLVEEATRMLVSDATSADVVQGILYSEFNVTRGPELVFQSPADFLRKEDFGILEKYLITKPELSGKLITIRVHDYQVISAPVHITGLCYARNYLLFNIAFVFECDTDASPFEPIVRKLAGVLRTLEINSGFIVSAEKQRLQGILNTIRTSLNAKGKCEIPVNASTIIRLEVARIAHIAPQVGAHEVPIPLCDLRTIDFEDFDWTIKELTPFIDGNTFAKAISSKSGIDLHIVLLALRALVAKKFIALVPMFQFHSIYLVTRNVGLLLQDEKLMHRAEEFTKLGPGKANQDAAKLFELYCDFMPRHPYWTVADFNENHNLLKLGIDVRRFVYFGVMEGILHKMGRHPFRETPAALVVAGRSDLVCDCGVVVGKDTFDKDTIDVDNVNHYIPASMLKGLHTTDEICCATEMSARDVAEVLDSDPYTIHFYRHEVRSTGPPADAPQPK